MSEKKLTTTQKVAEKRKARAPQNSGVGSDKQRHRMIERIRARASYQLFGELYDFLKDKSDIADILRKFYEVLDARYSFGSIKNSEYAAESLGTVLKDKCGMTIEGNFVFGDFFGDVNCFYGHEVRMFNIGRGHFLACDKCRTYIFVGSNLMSNWRQENKDIWRNNSDSVNGYEFIEWNRA